MRNCCNWLSHNPLPSGERVARRAGEGGCAFAERTDTHNPLTLTLSPRGEGTPNALPPNAPLQPALLHWL
ncbi:hypothetical protein Sp245p_23345 (plasmid) [Azospirillum baldaniorum]|uniref:Uncharacterized protein n=1 Tax=Azospirillum baldaniorum TaxID=1064539 RepID=A0A9P1JZA8_9PROT|nr:hypothetical protein Sp245p_23345 [Azospirillum baldaniorum]CCD02678.1 protein of unknown function [Azospirillum baldaniorum]